MASLPRTNYKTITKYGMKFNAGSGKILEEGEASVTSSTFSQTCFSTRSRLELRGSALVQDCGERTGEIVPSRELLSAPDVVPNAQDFYRSLGYQVADVYRIRTAAGQ